MMQMGMFEPVARARRGDPRSSHAAAAHVESTGRAGAQRTRAAAAVLANPGCTSQELAERTHIDRYELARRLPELREAGLVRNGEQMVTCRVTGRMAMTWHPV